MKKLTMTLPAVLLLVAFSTLTLAQKTHRGLPFVGTRTFCDASNLDWSKAPGGRPPKVIVSISKDGVATVKTDIYGEGYQDTDTLFGKPYTFSGKLSAQWIVKRNADTALMLKSATTVYYAFGQDGFDMKMCETPPKESNAVQPTPAAPPGGKPSRKGASELPIKKNDSAGMLAQGPAMLFKGTTSKLSNQDKQLIFEKLDFSLCRNKRFIVVKGSESCGDASAQAEVVDLNADGVEEVLVRWGNYCLAGNTGENSALFVRDNSGQFREALNLIGVATMIETRNMGFRDIEIGGPGFCFGVWRWNGNKYEYRCSREYQRGACAAKDIATVCR